jgi:ABC-2 type transport system permease protein
MTSKTISQMRREWRFMLRQRYVVVLLLCSLLVSAFAVITGLSEVNTQRQTIERLKQADEIDRAEAQAKHDDPGSLAYYSFHLTYSEPSNLAFAALGERDVYPWKHRIKMLALEGQIYESDAQNPELAQTGKMDFTFVISALSPLFLILLFHDLIASERTSGRHDFLVTTAKSSYALWGARVAVRFVAIFSCLLIPFYTGALISDTSITNVLLVSLWCAIYFAFWTAMGLFLGKKASSAPRIASGLIGLWALFAFVIPILGNLVINQNVHSPKGSDILLTQREAVNDAWDLPVKATMDAFIVTHPNYSDYKKIEDGFDWAWYYAFQQVGDQIAAPLSIEYRDVNFNKHQLAGYISMLSPPMLILKKLTSLAETNALAAFKYEQKIRDFHQSLRKFYYPWLFNPDAFDKTYLNRLPDFEQTPQNNPQL